jgi:malonyl CoA-acyl carrier protein transacylase
MFDMVERRKPIFLLVGNPQMSKDELMQTSDLFEVPSFRKVINRFDRSLGLSTRGSLQYEKQIASVAWSVGVHTAFVEGLSDRLHPGLLDQSNRRFQLMFTGHSVGEMAALIEAGVCDIPTMAWMLTERERITEHPVEAGLREAQYSGAVVARRMLAIVGMTPQQVEQYGGHMTAKFTEPVKILMANANTPRQAVVAMELLESEIKKLENEARTVADTLGEAISEIIDPITEQPIFSHIKVFDLGLRNAYHTALMQYEGRLYQRVIASKLTSENFHLPQERTVYSPTLPGWLSSSDLGPTYHTVGHILTKPVLFAEAMEEFKTISELVGIITADRTKVTRNMIKQNGVETPVSNIVDKESLEEAIDTAEEQIKQAA